MTAKCQDLPLKNKQNTYIFIYTDNSIPVKFKCVIFDFLENEKLVTYVYLHTMFIFGFNMNISMMRCSTITNR